MDIPMLLQRIILISLFSSVVVGYNILISPIYGEGSHFLAAAAIGQGLVDKGHNVSVLIGKAYEHRAKDQKYSNLSFFIFQHRNKSVKDVHDMFFHVNTKAFDNSELQMFEMFTFIGKKMAEDCEGVLQNIDFMKQFESIDAIIMDPSWMCGLLMKKMIERNTNHSKKITMISNTPNLPDAISMLFLGSHYNPSYQPEISTGFTNRMSFMERVMNVFYSGILFGVAHFVMIPPYNQVAKNTGLDEDFYISMLTWYKYFDLHIINSHFSSDFPIPLSPNIIFVGGGLTVRPPETLDQELEVFVNGSGDHGIILFTLGTYFASVTKFQPDFVDMFAEAFTRLPQRVIWQLKELPEKKLPPNVKVLPWVPQNDILAHPKLRLVITHGGNNGFQEACYHGVPMVIIPFFGDQPDVAARVEVRGMGRKIDKFSLSVDLIYETLQDVISNPKYRKTAREVSAIIKNDYMTGKERAAFWVEHFIKFGGDYLRSSSTELSFIQYYMLDVIVFLITILCVIVLVAFASIRFCVIRCCRIALSSAKSKKE